MNDDIIADIKFWKHFKRGRNNRKMNKIKWIRGFSQQQENRMHFYFITQFIFYETGDYEKGRNPKEYYTIKSVTD